jgi:hyperosmotically inducible protein
MKKLIPFVVSGILLAGTFGCQEAAKTGSQTPGTPNESSTAPAKPAANITPATEKATAKPTTAAEKKAEKKTVHAETKATGDLKTEVTKKLQEGLPSNKLEVEVKEGEIILKGTAASPEEVTKAEKLAQEVKGVKSVKSEVKVEATKKP